MDIEKIAENVKIRYDNKIEILAIMNVLHALLNNIFAFKNITFESCENYSSPKPLAYYGWNFLPSGGIKTALIRDLQGYLFNWFFDEVNEFNKNRYNDMRELHEGILVDLTPKEQKEKKIEFSREEKNFIAFKSVLKETSQAKLYNYCKIIEETKKGSLFFLDTEAGKTFEKAKLNKNETKDLLFDSYLDLYDGDLYPTDTVQTDREHISNIPANLIFTCDYSDILENQKILQSFKKFLKTGFARRTFFYCPTINNVYDLPVYEVEETIQAINDIRINAPEIKDLYNKANGNYKFSVEANKRIKEYKKEIDQKLKEMNLYNQKLPIEDEIVQIDLRHSTWKIIKLSVLYHLLDNPTNDRVQLNDFEKAIDFFNKTHSCLNKLIKQQATDEIDYLFNYLLANINQKVANDKLRNQKFVHNSKFSKWLQEIKPLLVQMCEEHNLGFADITLSHNQKFLAVYDDKHTVTDEGEIVHKELPEGSL